MQHMRHTVLERIICRQQLMMMGMTTMMFCMKTVMFSVLRMYLRQVRYHQMGPGDSVWWHPDLLHQVEEWNTSSAFNSVLYISG